MDLTKLKALEMPSADVEIDILGEKQSVKVFAFDDIAATRIYAAGTKDGADDSEITLEICRIVLNTCVPELSGDDAELLMSRALTDVALPIVKRARELREEYTAARAKEEESAEKNLPGANSTPDKS